MLYCHQLKQIINLKHTKIGGNENDQDESEILSVLRHAHGRY